MIRRKDREVRPSWSALHGWFIQTSTAASLAVTDKPTRKGEIRFLKFFKNFFRIIFFDNHHQKMTTNVSLILAMPRVSEFG